MNTTRFLSVVLLVIPFFGAASPADPAAIRALAAHDSIEAGEVLRTAAEQGQLTDPLAEIAASLLDDRDPFVRALAEWSLATRVARDNNGQTVVWPRKSSPPWFLAWSQLPPASLLELDYCRQGIVWGLHRDVQAIKASADKIVRRAEGVLARRGTGGHAIGLRSLRDDLVRRIEAAPTPLAAHRRAWLELRHAAREIVLQHAPIDFDRVLFVAGYPGHSLRNITGSQYPWAHKPGGDLCVKTGFHPADPASGLIDGRLGPGHVHGADLWWNADRVVFGFARQPNWPPPFDTVEGNDSYDLRRDQEPTHLYEIVFGGGARQAESSLRQLTDHPSWSDFEPTYCADGSVVFASDRSGRSSECGKFSADHTVINLYVLSADGQTLRRLNDNKDIDRYPHSLDDGTIAYTRWDYQERHFFEIHSVWTVRPDGTMADALFKQHLPAPYGLRDTRSIPGSRKLVSIATGHHTLAYGPVVVIDPRQGISEAAAIRIVTPGVAPQEGPMGGTAVVEGGVPDRGGLYHTPWALSDDCFLVAYSYGNTGAESFAIYLVDVFGNKELIHRDLLLSGTFPMPLRQRPRPPVLPPATTEEARLATCYIPDVYEGWPEMPRGSVKYLRIAQRVGWPLDAEIGAMRWIPGNAWTKQPGFYAWAPPRVLGTVRVEDDGSACFQVPADEAIYFQALDEQHMELRRMRSHVTLQAGEVRGCRGCHETQNHAPKVASAGLAMRREPEFPIPPPWGNQKLLGFEWLIQPIFDKHCTRCHSEADAQGGIDLSGTPQPDGFFQSYRTLLGLPSLVDPSQPPVRPLVICSDRFSGASVSGTQQFGSHKSPLVQVLLNDESHRAEVKLAAEEWIALVTWVDANAPYYDTFYNKRPADGGPPRRDVRIELPDPFAAGTPPTE